MKRQMIPPEQIETEASMLMEYLEHKFGKNRVGVAVFLFELDRAGVDVTYVSNAQHRDMIAVVENWLARVKAILAADPPGPRGEG